MTPAASGMTPRASPDAYSGPELELGLTESWEQPALSPDGRRVAFVRSSADPASNCTLTALCVREIAGRHDQVLIEAGRPTAHAANLAAEGTGIDTDDGRLARVAAPYWLDLDTVVCIVVVDNALREVRAVDVSGPQGNLAVGSARALERLLPGTILTRWHPKGTHLLAAAPLSGNKPVATDFDGAQPVAPVEFGLYRHSLDGSAPELVHAWPHPYQDAAWSPDGLHLAAVVPYGPDPEVTDVTVALSLSSVAAGDPTSAQPILVGGRDGHVQTVSFSSDGAELIVIGRPDTNLGNMLATAYPVASGTGMHGVPVDSGTPLLSGLDLNVAYCRPGAKHGKTTGLAVARVRGPRVCIPVHDPETPGGEQLQHKGISAEGALLEHAQAGAAEIDVVEMTDFPVDGSHCAVVRTRYAANALALVDAVTGELMVLDQSRSPEPPTARTVEERSWLTPAGPVHGWILTSSAARPGPRRVLVDLHHGPHSAWTGLREPSHGHHEWLLDRGWAIVLLNTSGSDGYGEGFMCQVRTAWGRPDAAQVLAVTDQLLAEGAATPGSMAVSGYSYGAFLAATLLTRPHPFAAAVCVAGVYDLADYSRTSALGDVFVNLEMGGVRPEQAPDLYHRLSPVHQADRVRVPTLVLHGVDDFNSPSTQAVTWFDALRRSSATAVELDLLRGAGHEFAWSGPPAARLRYQQRLVQWLDDHVPQPL